jgi:HEAT repeat protein
MSRNRWIKAGSIFVLSLSLVVLSSVDDLAAASKKEEAKKYTDALKKAKPGDVKTRIEAISKLGDLGQIQYNFAIDAIPDLLKATEDKDAGVRAAAARAIGKIGVEDKAAVTALTKLLKDGNETVKFAAVEGLGAMNTRAKDAVSDLRGIRKNLDKKDKLAKAIDNSLKSIMGKNK